MCVVRVADDKEAAESMAQYVTELLEDALHETTQKPSGTVLKLIPDYSCSNQEAIDAISSQKEPVSLGQWVKGAMCLVPVQISRCTCNSLEPMHDGQPRTDVSDEEEDIVDLSKSLRLGNFEFILNAHVGPVKVVAALGQQSVGKSYQLNHLGGMLFIDK
jgi:hypothetical protein